MVLALNQKKTIGLFDPWRERGTLSGQLTAITEAHWVALQAFYLIVFFFFFFYIFNANKTSLDSIFRLLHSARSLFVYKL